MTNDTANATKSLQVELASRPEGKPDRSNFSVRSVELSPIEEGQILVKNHWMSVDPYMRGRMKEGDSYVSAFEIDEPLEGGCVGEIVQSRHPHLRAGQFVLGRLGWRQFWRSDGSDVQVVDPDLAPLQTYLGVLGMPGLTAWVGLNKIAQLQPNQTVFVSAASGAVGSVVCQLAKAKGCHVIGSAGKPEKIAWLRDKAGVEDVIHYKQVDDLAAKLQSLAPDGIDVYYDNVGGEHLEAAIDTMNDFGVCVECGMISIYNATEPPSAPQNLFKVIAKRIRMQGFIVSDHLKDQDEFFAELAPLIQAGKIVWEETITEGLENAADAFIGLFEGSNLGKSLVRITPS